MDGAGMGSPWKRDRLETEVGKCHHLLLQEAGNGLLAHRRVPAII